jgi:tetratricopeptide (TPR) repeat protein
MPSIIPGFEYDIFISYRQKDNKYDGWVSDFVANLKRELEATFKEEISVYFDENPHDGLLETHNVDKSLEGKLKCLVFIPIISQTYCDPKSFAWQNEFVAFNKIARSDEFGKDIKLNNGNVASRVLPIRIHDLNLEDKALFEKELGSVLRPVDFIFKSPGVCRSLRSNEDSPSSNQNKTFYRDQINKVANSIREIINGMLHLQHPETTLPRSSYANVPTQQTKIQKWKLNAIIAVLVLIGFAAIGWFTTRKADQQAAKKLRDATIAILPFENQTNNSNLNPIGQIAADFISTKLIQNRFWQVIPSQDVFKRTVYSGVVSNPQAEQEMTNEGDVDLIVMGHYNPLPGDSLMVVASVNDIAARKVLYTTPIISCAASNPMKAISDIQQFIVGFLMFSKDEDNATPTRPPRYDAYEEYLTGMELWTKNELGPANIAIRIGTDIEKHFKRSIALDPDFLPPYFKLTEMFAIDRKLKRLDSVLTILESKKSLFLEGDLLNYTIHKFQLTKDWLGLEKFLLTKTNIKSRDFRPYYLLGVNALYRLNKPQAALDYLALCDMKDFDFERNPSDQLFYSVKASALIKLKRYDEVEKLTGSLGLDNLLSVIKTKRWLALYYQNRKDLADKEFTDYFSSDRPVTGYAFPHMSLFRAALLTGDTAAASLNYRRLLKYEEQLNQVNSKTTWSSFIRAVMMLRMNDNIPEAEKLLKQENPIVEHQRRIHQLGILYAVTGRPDKAKEVIDDLLAHENPYNGNFTRYFIAKIELALGNKDKSMDYLQQSLKKGMEFGEELFEYDSDLKDLLDYPPFIELVKPKG